MCSKSLHSHFSTPLPYAILSNDIKPFYPITFLLLFKSLSTKLITLTSSNLFYYSCKPLTNVLWYSHTLSNTMTIVWNVYDMYAMYVWMNMRVLQFSPPYKISSSKFFVYLYPGIGMDTSLSYLFSLPMLPPLSNGDPILLLPLVSLCFSTFEPFCLISQRGVFVSRILEKFYFWFLYYVTRI